MKRGSGSGGGQSSLGYLFGPDAEKQKKEAALPPPPPSPTTTCAPPYGIDIDSTSEKSPETSSDYIRVQGNNSGNSITGQGRPSTRVKSVPGGDSSLGYLFGDK